jgi:IclR family pca regulon transcriptional regulator
VGAHAARVSRRKMVEEFLPVLLKGAQELSILLP